MEGDRPEIWAGGATGFIGRSCFVVRLCGHVFMLDCGLDQWAGKRNCAPPFSSQSLSGAGIHIPEDLEFVAISHFHIDHSMGLPDLYWSRKYRGPIFMTLPTRVNLHSVIQDFSMVSEEHSGRDHKQAAAPSHLKTDGVDTLLSGVTVVDFYRPLSLCGGDIELTFLPAGHLLGAASVRVRSRANPGFHLLYTGDFNYMSDSHLPPAAVLPHSDADGAPDLLIVESTQLTTVRESESISVSRFLEDVAATVLSGGKVLIPVYALGRAQEMCQLLDELWSRVEGLSSVPLCMTQGLLEEITNCYQRSASAASFEALLATVHSHTCGWPHLSRTGCADRIVPAFTYQNIRPYTADLLSLNGPCVAIASPGALSSGISLQAFFAWCEDPRNLVVFPGQPPSGSSAEAIFGGHFNAISVDHAPPRRIRARLCNLVFAGHADMRGLVGLVEVTRPRAVCLVHGPASKIASMVPVIKNELGINCYNPTTDRWAKPQFVPVCPSSQPVSEDSLLPIFSPPSSFTGIIQSDSFDNALSLFSELLVDASFCAGYKAVVHSPSRIQIEPGLLITLSISGDGPLYQASFSPLWEQLASPDYFVNFVNTVPALLGFS